MSAVFISFTGTQIMGTLGPLRAMAQKIGDVRTVLLSTPKTTVIAERVLRFAADRGLGPVQIVNFPDSSISTDDIRKIFKRLTDEVIAEGSRVWFNLDGGMNYIIGAAVSSPELMGVEPVLIQISDHRVTAFDTSSGIAEEIPYPQPLGVSEIMLLQGMDSKKALDDGSSSLLWKMIKKSGVDLTSNCVKNISIGGVDFNLIWNRGNDHLAFLKFFPPDKNEKLAGIRNLAGWAASRERSANLFDRSVIAVVFSKFFKEHLEEDGKGKLQVIMGRNKLALQKLAECLAPFSDGCTNTDAAVGGIDKVSLADGTLVVCLGTNLHPTLKAISAHKPRHLALCMTPGNEIIAGYAKQIAALKESFGLESVRVFPCSIEGIELPEILPKPDPEARVNVNITPGTKGQAGMLAMWACRNGCPVWSIKNDVCLQISVSGSEQSISVDPLPLELHLKIACKNVRMGRGLTANRKKFLEGMLEIMRLSIENGRDSSLLQEEMHIGGILLKRDPDNATGWILSKNNKVLGKTTSKHGKTGDWFEDLVALALQNAGGTDIHTGVKFSWLENLPEYQPQGHRLELDVVGQIGGQYVVISCKSGKNGTLAVPAREVRDVAGIFGRFTMRMLVSMKCSKPYFMEGDQVMVLGWRELCRPDIFLQVIEDLKQHLQTTAKKEPRQEQKNG